MDYILAANVSLLRLPSQFSTPGCLCSTPYYVNVAQVKVGETIGQYMINWQPRLAKLYP